MPKQKTHSGASKRFTISGTGKVRGRHGMSSHNLEHKSAKRKRDFARPITMDKDTAPRIKKLLGK
ncbi:MAG: 50S ribosomal protein L35 [Solirubrobacterales bacterium]